MDSIIGSIGYGNFLIVLCILIFFHELGHYLVARLCGVTVETFSIGFGKEIIGWTDKHHTRWKISMIPLGGYVKMRGEMMASPEDALHHDDHHDHDTSDGVFHHKPILSRILIVAAGPIANFIYAWVVLALLFIFVGLPSQGNMSTQGIGGVVPESSAALAGFRTGDIILKANGYSIAEFNDLRQAISQSDGRRMTFHINRNGQELFLNARPKKQVTADGQENYILGVRPPLPIYKKLGLSESIIHGASQTYDMIVLTIQGLSSMIMGAISVNELSGPVGIVKLSNDVAQLGFVSFVTFTAILSINLGLLNLLPIPMLDGGHLIFYIIEMIFRRPIPVKIQNAAMRIGMAFLLLIMIFVTINDIVNISL